MAVALHVVRAISTRTSSVVVVDESIVDTVEETSEWKKLVRYNVIKEGFFEMHRVRFTRVLVWMNGITLTSSK